MKTKRFFFLTLTLAMLISLLSVLPVGAQSGSTIRQIPVSGTTSFQAGPTATDPGQGPEFVGTEGDEGAAAYGGSIVNRSYSKGVANGPSVNSAKKPKSNPVLDLSFNGLNLYDQRYANNGNQYTVEPPDQGLCVGNGYVMETVNDVLRVYDTSGNALLGVVDQNTFYGYPPALTRPAGPPFGPFVTDPSCLFDGTTQRWFHVVLTLDRDPATAGYLGSNHLDIAVSDTASPLGTWHIYRVPVQNDGTDGTPDHGCTVYPSGFGPCIGDYPHIGADAHGFYVTTNEYAFFGLEYKSAIIYAFSKQALAAGGSVNVVEFDTPTSDNGRPGFTVWPAVSPDGQYKGNTEYFLSSTAADEVQCPDGTCSGTGASDYILLWTLSKTNTLDSASPSLSLSNQAIPVGMYGTPPKAEQKAGDYPYGQSLGAPLGVLDASDTRMQQVVYANGKVWSALETAVTVNGVNKAGIAWFILNPNSAKLDKSGYLALANNNVTYPAVGVTKSGRGVIAFTLVGADYYPSAAYASLDAKIGAGDIQIAVEGLGPQDGFTEYGSRPRWGDYGAAAMDGNSIWIASEYIGQTCTLTEWQADFTCGGTRGQVANWGTRISKLTP
jgi:hypothetical protein